MENAYKIAQIDILDPPKNENAYCFQHSANSTLKVSLAKEKNSTDIFAVSAGLSISANKVKISNMVNRQTATELICNLRWISRNQKEKLATKNQNKDLEGRYNNFFLLKLKPHILDSNGVW